MPSIESDFLEKLHCNYTDYTNFIETGTYHGETIFYFEPFFQKLYTIEIKQELYEETKNSYQGDKIQFYHGDSSQVLNHLLPEINGKTIIFLDGHWSCDDTGRGTVDCPLYNELYSIMNHHSHECVIIIDDVRLFGKGPNKTGEQYDLCNWEGINQETVFKIVKERFTNIYLLPSSHGEKDRMIIHLEKI